jgi:hypothetical protein
MTEVQEHANVIETVRVREAVGVVHSREQLEKLIDQRDMSVNSKQLHRCC